MSKVFTYKAAAAVCIAALSTGAALAEGHSMAPAPVAAGPSLAFPAIFGAASAIPAPGGTGFAALNYANPRGGVSGRDADGDMSFGYTVGNPIDAVSATITLNILSLDGLGDSGNLGFNVARLLRAGGSSATFVGASLGSIAPWGDAEDDDMTYSVYASHLTAISTQGGGEIPVQITLGYGDATTLSGSGNGDISDGVFYGVGFGVAENLSLSVSGTETQLNVGMSASIPQVPGLGMSAGFYDVTDNADRQQFSLGIAYAF